MADLKRSKGQRPDVSPSPPPDWALNPLPTNAVVDEQVVADVDKACRNLPDGLPDLMFDLHRMQTSREFDAAANHACERVWQAFQSGQFATWSPWHRASLVEFATSFLPPRAQARILRRLAKDPSYHVRRKVSRKLINVRFHEVGIPRSRKESASEEYARWDQSGWKHGLERGEGRRARAGIQDQLGLPQLGSIAQLRDFLGIRSNAQLGWMLLATDQDDGPYTRFEIPKRNGDSRVICAPKWQLRRVQKKILEEILYRVPVHAAAHGFVPGRSTVTNAQPHVGSAVVIKFDLQDFFPTVHHFRVAGLFASLGYDFADGRFSTRSRSAQIAPTLARLCMYTPDPRPFGDGFLPQGAPTSPAITNLICRTLDIRLTGLASHCGGVYTRYADDLTFSFPKQAPNVGRFRWWVGQICHQEGFNLHEGKFRVIRASQRQQVTGIVVNDSLRIPRHQRRRFRAILHNCRKHGIASQERGRAGFRGWLLGYASYLHMVHPEEGRTLLDEARRLVEAEDRAAGESE